MGADENQTGGEPKTKPPPRRARCNALPPNHPPAARPSLEMIGPLPRPPWWRLMAPFLGRDVCQRPCLTPCGIQCGSPGASLGLSPAGGSSGPGLFPARAGVGVVEGFALIRFPPRRHGAGLEREAPPGRPSPGAAPPPRAARQRWRWMADSGIPPNPSCQGCSVGPAGGRLRRFRSWVLALGL